MRVSVATAVSFYCFSVSLASSLGRRPQAAATTPAVCHGSFESPWSQLFARSRSIPRLSVTVSKYCSTTCRWRGG